jgi:hypothetical protein
VAVITPIEELPTSQLGREVAEVRTCGERTTQTDSQDESATMGLVLQQKKQLKFLCRETCQKESQRHMVRRGEPLSKPPLWVKLNFKVSEVLSLVDTGAQFSRIRRDVMQTLVELGVRVQKGTCKLSCHLANGLSCEIRETVKLHFLQGTFSRSFQFKILEQGPFPILLGLDFLSYSKMVIDMAGREYYFSFAPGKLMKFEYLMSDVVNKEQAANSYFRQLEKEASKIVKLN